MAAKFIANNLNRFPPVRDAFKDLHTRYGTPVTTDPRVILCHIHPRISASKYPFHDRWVATKIKDFPFCVGEEAVLKALTAGLEFPYGGYYGSFTSDHTNDPRYVMFQIPHGRTVAEVEAALRGLGLGDSTSGDRMAGESIGNGGMLRVPPVPAAAANTTTVVAPVPAAAANTTMVVAPVPAAAANTNTVVAPVPSAAANTTMVVAPVPAAAANRIMVGAVHVPAGAGNRTTVGAVPVPARAANRTMTTVAGEGSGGGVGGSSQGGGGLRNGERIHVNGDGVARPGSLDVEIDTTTFYRSPSTTYFVLCGVSPAMSIKDFKMHVKRGMGTDRGILLETETGTNLSNTRTVGYYRLGGNRYAVVKSL
ncbi:hypothetical protein HDV00_010787 [Rhizophlyctis rosea]|nr:hypothetical protein HDV00_010787 [Rhizophlyctis rosea]